MSRSIVFRIVETFFRRWWLVLVPLVLLSAMGWSSAAHQERSYRSMGTLYAQSESFLSSLTAVRGGSVGWQTAAGYYSQQLGGLLQTDTFLGAVAERAGLDAGAQAPRPSGVDEVRASVFSWSSGDNLIQVAASHRDPRAAQAIAGAVIETFVQWQIDSDASGSAAAQEFFGELVAAYDEDVAASRAALDQYLVANPDPEPGTLRPLAQQVALKRLEADVSLAEQRLSTATVKEEEARLATAQTERDVRQRFRVVDAPAVPLIPETGLRTVVTDVALFVAMGLAISIAALLAATFLDRSVRNGLDVTQVLGAELLAVLPEQRTGRGRWRLRSGGAGT